MTATGWRPFAWAGACLFAVAVAACGDDNGGPGPGDNDGAVTPGGAMLFESPAFTSGSAIPIAYTCDGDDASPPLRWEDVPREAEALAIEMIDPDADGFVHWMVFDIPPDAGGVTAGVNPGARLDDGSKQAVNSFGNAGYGGPCPPEGEEHEYIFRLYALDAALGIEGGGSADEVQDALAEHTLALSELAVVYSR